MARKAIRRKARGWEQKEEKLFRGGGDGGVEVVLTGSTVVTDPMPVGDGTGERGVKRRVLFQKRKSVPSAWDRREGGGVPISVKRQFLGAKALYGRERAGGGKEGLRKQRQTRSD